MRKKTSQRTEQLRKATRKYRQKYPDRVRRSWTMQNEKLKAWRLENPIKYWAQKTIQHHKTLGYEVRITSQQILQLVAQQKERCLYCEKKVDFKSPTLTNLKATLDRVHNSKIVSFRTVSLLCHSCNSSKRDRTHRRFVAYCRKIVSKFDIATGPNWKEAK